MVDRLTIRWWLAWPGAFLALLFTGSVAWAQTATLEFYAGAVGKSRVELAFLRQSTYGPYRPSHATSSELYGALYWVQDRVVSWRGEPLQRLHGIVGTESGNRVALRELTSLDNADSVAATLTAQRAGTTLRGEWRETGSSRPVPFSLSRVRFPSSLRQADGRIGAVLSEAHSTRVQVALSLHRALRERAWARAHLNARILCTLSFVWGGGHTERHVDRPDNCGWVLPTYRLANDLDLSHDEIGVGPWSGLDLGAADAFLLYRMFCTKQSVVACALMVDVASHVAADRSRPALLAACETWRIGCGEYWSPEVVALADAARDGQLEQARQLLQSPMDVNAGSGLFLSPLLQAVLSKSLPMVRLLLEHHADPEFVPKGTVSPLSYALEEPDDTLALLLLDHGATTKTCEQCIMQAVGGKHHRVLQRLLKLGAHPDSGAAPGGSPLTLAVDRGDLAAAKLLLAHGADPDLSTKFSDGSPLDHARTQRRTEMIPLLEEASRKKQ